MVWSSKNKARAALLRGVSLSMAAWCLSAAGASAAPSITPIEAQYDTHLSSADQDAWLKALAAEPNHVGSPHDKANAEWLLAQFRKWGWDARIETFQVLFPTPISETLEMGDFKASFVEPPIPGDTSARMTQPALPGYLAYQGDGDVTAPLVYVNYGTEADYEELALAGVSVKGKIVIARFGQVWRGVKPLLAAQHGAIGCITFSDPADDGYGLGASYPNGPTRPAHGIQRGSAMDMMLYPGDPLTPGVGATANARRLTKETAGSIMTIPAVPISYADAQVLLSAMDGPVAPKSFRGGLPITYRLGAGTKPVHLAIKSSWDLKPVYDVIAQIKGAKWPDQWVVRGNHHDGWVAGAGDPLSGQVAMLDEARSLGALVKAGWKPKRTIVYTSWDGEEPMLLGSTEWAEQHDKEIQQKAVLYLNTDGNSRGFLEAGGSQDLDRFMTGVAESVTDPEAHVSVAARARARLLTQAARPGAGADAKARAKLLAGADGMIPLSAIGSGSDFSPFFDHLGVSTINLGFGGESEGGGGVYHSLYDTHEHFTRFEDPGLVYGRVLSATVGHAVIRAADADLPLQSPTGFAAAIALYVANVKELASHQRDAAAAQQTLLAKNAFAIAADPTEPHGSPIPQALVPTIDFTGLDSAVTKLAVSASAYEAAIGANTTPLAPAKLAKLQATMNDITQTLCSDAGLPGRPWFKNVIYAPGRYIGYGVTTLPGVTESIGQRQWSDVPRQIQTVSDALAAYAARLDTATGLLR